MTEVYRHHYFLKLIVIVLTSNLVKAYENAYDLTQRRDQVRNDPNNRYYESSETYYNRYHDRDRYSTHNQRPSSVYSAVRPGTDFITRTSSNVGNGYDNLGNSGIGPVRRRDWDRFLEPRNYDSWRDRKRFNEPRRWRNTDFLDDRRSNDDSFADRFEDRRRSDSFRVFDNYDDRRSIDPIRDSKFEDRLSLDLSGNPGSLDDKRTIDAFREAAGQEPVRRLAVDTLEQPRSLPADTFELPRVIDSPRKISIDHRSRQRSRIDQPEFYRKDYFIRKTPAGESSYETENSDKNYQSAAGEKENSGISTVGSYVTSNEDQNQKKTDTGFHDNKEGAKLDVANKEKIGETTRFDKNGGNKSTARSNRVSKKGHTTKGFATHHHKDETGNTTTFFDESSDTDGKTDYQDLEDEFGTRRTIEVVNGREDGRFFQENGGRSGNFGSGVLKDNKKFEKDVVAKDDRFNKEERFGDGQDHFDRGFKTASEYLGGGVWNDPLQH